MQTRKPGSLRLLRREASQKRSTGGSEGVSEAEISSANLRIGTWNCGGLSNLTMKLCRNLKFDILALTETHGWNSDKAAVTHSNFPVTTKKAANPTVKCVRDIDATIRMRILENHNSCVPETEQNSIKDAFKNHGSQYCRRGPHTDGNNLNEYERPPVELAPACHCAWMRTG